MKKFLFASLLIGLFAATAECQTKRALIIAIGNYPDPEKNGWMELSSLHDVPLVQTALERQNFKTSNIWTLLDEQATKTGIEKALDRLIDSAREGDIIVIHVSSHGQQIEDDNVNEEQDGLDECIVPYGAVYSSDKSLFSKVSSGYLRDDVFGEKITRLRNKVKSSGDILVSLDACHSGTGTRGGGTAKARGSLPPMVSNNFDKKKMGLKDAAGVFKEATTTSLNKNAATYVVISGAQAQEKNYECLDDSGNTAGSLSYALSKALTTLEGKISYRTLFALIEDVMREKAPQQKPVLEGDGIDRELFGGKYLRQLPYLPVDMAHSNKDTIYLKSGTIAGLTLNSTVGFYPSGTIDPKGIEPIQKGTVVIATNFTSAVKLDKENSEFLVKAPWPFLTEMSYGSNTIKLGIDSLDMEETNSVKDALKDYQLAEINSNCELYFGRSATGSWALKYANSGIVFSDNIDLRNSAGIRSALKRYDRFRYLRDLKFSEQGLSAKVDLVFLTAKNKIDLAKMKSRTKFGRLELRVGDTVYLNIKNTGAKKFYVNIVDIQPDGIINRLLPNRTLTNIAGLPAPILPENCGVERRDSLFITDMMIVIGQPVGEEIFKVFLSTQLLDLEDILAGNGDANSRERGILNNLAKIFESSEPNALGSRGATPKVSTAQDGTIFSLNFAIRQ